MTNYDNISDTDLKFAAYWVNSCDFKNLHEVT